MKIIKTITYLDIIGKDGLSQAVPRLTARAVLMNNNNQYALIHTKGFGIYAFVGGGVEENEDIVTALKREVFEETGCSCDEIIEIGCIIENRNHCNYTQHNYYYFVKTNTAEFNPSFTDSEISYNASLNWYSLEEVIRLLDNNKGDTPQKKFLIARDKIALQHYLNEVKND